MKKIGITISETRQCEDLTSLGSIMVPIVKSALSEGDLIEADIMFGWTDIIGEGIASFCRPLKTKFNPKDSLRTLFLEVPTGGFALELKHKENYILEKINAYFGYKAIHKININQNANMKIKIKREIRKKDEEHLSSAEKNYIDKLASGIDDEILKENLLKLAKSVIMLNKGESENDKDGSKNK